MKIVQIQILPRQSQSSYCPRFGVPNWGHKLGQLVVVSGGKGIYSPLDSATPDKSGCIPHAGETILSE